MERLNMASLVGKIKDGTITEEDLQDFAGKLCQKATEDALRTVPQVVDHLTKQAFYLRKLSSEFYRQNKDLAAHRSVVTQVIEQMEAHNPELSYEDLLKKAAPEVRNRLKDMPNMSSGERPRLDDLDKKLGDI